MKIKILVVFILCGFYAIAQQEPHYTQYMYNMSTVNPAYMLNEPGLIQAGTLYRTQWVGIDGAPKTANVFANIPISNKIELAVNYLNDQIGDVLTTNVFNVDAAYKIKLNQELNLSFGLKVGINNNDFDFSQTNVSTDPLFQNSQKTNLAIGAGAFLFKDSFYVGLSSSNLLPGSVNVSNEGVLFENKPHIFLIGGYVFQASDMIKVKPSAVVKQVIGAPVTFDVSANAIYNDKFELGVSYRYQDAVAALAAFNINSSLKIGYAYDFNTSPLKDFNSGSHEFILLYTFDVIGLSKNYSSPRFY